MIENLCNQNYIERHIGGSTCEYHHRQVDHYQDWNRQLKNDFQNL